MTKQELLRTYDALMLCAEQGKYGETKETVRKWLEWAVEEVVATERKDAYAHAGIIREREINHILKEVIEEESDTFGNASKIILAWMKNNACDIHTD